MPLIFEKTNYNQAGSRKSKLRTFLLVAIIVLVLGGIGLIAFKVFGNVKQASDSPGSSSNANQDQKAEEKPSLPPFNNERIASLVNAWSSSTKGTKGVVVTDENGNLITTINPDEPFFMASIYKLYVAYLGYQEVDARKHSLDEPYLGNFTRGKCLDEMIRNSHSPCGEKMMAELDRQKIEDKLKTYGLANTDFGGFTTTAGDVGIILKKIWKGEELSPDSRGRLLASMLGQQYRDGLAKGFAPAKVYNKVGFRELDEYHDVGIIEFDDNRVMIVAVMTSNTGLSNIVKLAEGLNSNK